MHWNVKKQGCPTRRVYAWEVCILPSRSIPSADKDWEQRDQKPSHVSPACGQPVRVQLAQVIQVCRDSRSMSEAGRQLLDASRTRKTSTNDADRLRKYLGRFGIEWNHIAES